MKSAASDLEGGHRESAESYVSRLGSRRTPDRADGESDDGVSSMISSAETGRCTLGVEHTGFKTYDTRRDTSTAPYEDVRNQHDRRCENGKTQNQNLTEEQQTPTDSKLIR